MKITNSKVYDILKALAILWLPALGTLYFTLAGIWDLPHPEQVVGTIVAVDTFLGVLLGLSQNAYKKEVVEGGVMKVVEHEDGSKKFSLELEHDPEELENKKEVHFKVEPTKRKQKDPGETDPIPTGRHRTGRHRT